VPSRCLQRSPLTDTFHLLMAEVITENRFRQKFHNPPSGIWVDLDEVPLLRGVPLGFRFTFGPNVWIVKTHKRGFVFLSSIPKEMEDGS
jgi:hypothetical protein